MLRKLVLDYLYTYAATHVFQGETISSDVIFWQVSKKRKRKFSDDQPATLQLAEQQKLLLDEQLKVVKLQQEGERERNAEHVKLLKLQQEGVRERNTEQVKLLKLQTRGRKTENSPPDTAA